MRLLNCLMVLLIAGSGITITSCNAKEEETLTDNYVASESVAVTGFSLAADLRVMRNLDSVFFSIDLEHGVIFNADSLPKGTNITKLTPKIKYPSSVKTAVIEMTGGTHREGTVNYYNNANDTIDFTGSVKLTLGTTDNEITKTYTLKVNVHQADPDTIYWENTATMALPSRMADPLEQKSIAWGNGVMTIVKEADSSYTLATTSDIFEAIWTKQQLEPGFTPALHTLTPASDGTLYMLSESGELMASADGARTWSSLDSGWQEIIGMYGEILLGTSLESSTLTMKSWPQGSMPAMEMPAGFPLTGYTSPVEFINRWTPDPTIVIFGGYPFASSGKSPAWAFDGSQWVNIAENALPSMQGMSVVKYYSYLNSSSNGLLKEFEVFLAFGGIDANGNLNNTIYVSYDYGINWQKAQEYMQLPASMVSGSGLDALTLGTSMQSNLSDRWKSAPSRRKLPFVIDGDIVKWECPYIFLFGGYDSNGKLIGSVRSGVLQRLTFEPLF